MAKKKLFILHSLYSIIRFTLSAFRKISKTQYFTYIFAFIIKKPF